MNILMDPLPDSLVVSGREYAIRSDFRTAIRFEELMRSGTPTKEQEAFAKDLCRLDPETEWDSALWMAKYREGLELYYEEVPEDLQGAIEAMIWFYGCGKENIDRKQGKGSAKQVYSYQHDADYIYAAFYEQYHIDLARQELHWWKFSALFSALSDECMISKIMMYRSIDTKDMDKGQRNFYNKMKRLYALPKDITKEERERQDRITEALLNGGDLTGLL